MSKSAYELRYDLLALSYDLLSQHGKANPKPSEIIAAAKEFNDFVSNNSDRKVFNIDVGGMSPEAAKEAIEAIRQDIQDTSTINVRGGSTAAKERRKLFEDGEGSNLANFAHKLDDFAHQAVGLALQETGCCGNRKDCNGGADTCDCNN